MEEDDSNKWFRDPISPDFIQFHKVQGVSYSGKTKFQAVEVVQTSSFGQCLVLDGKIQSSESDEFIYHEALVHPAMIAHPCPRTVFIAGGGEGATLRQVLSYRSVEKVVMVDIDKEAVDICSRFLPVLNQGSFEDKRLELLHLDAREYLSNSRQRFDVIIIDLTDPVEGGPSYLLYTQQFYRLVQERLTEEGIISVQSGPLGLKESLCFVAVNNTLRSVFPAVLPYQAYMPSYGGLWGFNIAARQKGTLSLSVEEVNRRVSEKGSGRLGFYDGITHQNMFSLPLYIRQEISRGKRLITDENPLVLV